MFGAGSSNGRTTPFGGVCRGSNPLPAAELYLNIKILTNCFLIIPGELIETGQIS